MTYKIFSVMGKLTWLLVLASFYFWVSFLSQLLKNFTNISVLSNYFSKIMLISIIYSDNIEQKYVSKIISNNLHA